jgi:hypothetical protein
MILYIDANIQTYVMPFTCRQTGETVSLIPVEKNMSMADNVSRWCVKKSPKMQPN